jgi:hypothetical protein
VVVVLSDVFGQLKAKVVVVCRDSPDDTSLLQVNEVPVGRAARQPRRALCNIFDAHRVTSVGQQLNNLTTPVGIALRDQSQPLLHQAV